MMMIRKLLCILSLAIAGLSVAQTKYSTTSDDFNTYHATVSAAERMFRNDSLLQAYAKFDIAFDNYKGGINPTHYFKAALCAIKIKEEFKALHYLEKAITNGYEIDSNKLGLVVFNNQNTKQEYQANIGKWNATRDATRNTSFEGELYTFAPTTNKIADAKYNEALTYCNMCNKTKTCSKTATDYVSKNKILKERMKADSVVAAKLLTNINQYGFPNLKIVGKKACEIARTILLNYDADKTNERLDGILFKALNDGYISPSFYAQVIDRRNTKAGLAPEFYEPITGYEKTIAASMAGANNKRKTIGLYNIILPPKIVQKSASTAKGATITKPTDVSLYDY
jgi:hypothetical protein